MGRSLLVGRVACPYNGLGCAATSEQEHRITTGTTGHHRLKESQVRQPTQPYQAESDEAGERSGIIQRSDFVRHGALGRVQVPIRLPRALRALVHKAVVTEDGPHRTVRVEPTAQADTGVILGDRATSVPFTAVLIGR